MVALRKYIPTLAVAALGTVLTVVVYQQVQTQESHLASQNFLRVAIERAAVIRGQLDGKLLRMRALAGFFDGSETVARDEFKEFSDTLQKDSSPSYALQWVPKVTAGGRAYYEEMARKAGLENFVISERSALGDLQPASERETYFPIYYSEPQRPNDFALGFDLASLPERLEALEKARDEGIVVATEPFALAHKDTDQTGVMLLAPVYARGLPHGTVLQRRTRLRGFVVEVLSLESLIGPARATANRVQNETPYHLYVYDSTPGSSEREIVIRNAPGEADAQTGDIEESTTIVPYEETLSVGGRTWRLVFHATDDERLSISAHSWNAALISLLLTAMASWLVFMSSRRREQIENVVLARTAELTQVTQAALQNEARIKAVIDNTSEGMIVIDHTGKIETYNPAAERIFGYHADEVIGQDVAMLLPMDEREAHQGYVRNSTLHDQRVINRTRDLKGRRKDGTEFFMELNVARLHLENDKKFVGIFRDITERKQAEDALRASEMRFRDFTETASDWIWEMDASFRFTHVSDNFFELAALKPSDILGHSRWDYFDVQSAGVTPEAWERHRAQLESHQPFRDFRYWITDKVGKRLHININGKPVFAPDGTFMGYRGTGANITAVTRAAEELRKARDAAEQANVAKSKFLSSMSHELRTPLNAILGFGQLLDSDRKPELAPKQKDAVGHILASGKHLLGLINDVLDLAKVESGDIGLSLERVNPTEVIDACVTMTASMGSAKNITVENRCADELPWIHADHMRFKQVLLNFLSNAVKYNVEGGQVILDCAQVGGSRMRFSITDTGPGLSELQQRELFQPFNRLGMETSNVEGTGIGLVITRELIGLMGGELGFESARGKGSTFWFELPLSAEQTQAQTFSSTADENDHHVPGDDGHATMGTVLYVEDNPANVALMQRIGELFEGLELIIATTAEDGLDLVRSRSVDLVLMDINLPGMSGLEALEVMKGEPELARIPVVAISANAMSRDVQRALDAGFDAYLTKPIEVSEVVNAINTHLGATQVR